MVDSSDFAKVLAEADDIAQSVGQRLTTAHVLLALFTVENGAARLLRERGVDEDVLLERLEGAPSEPEGLVRELSERAREIARSCGSAEADCLHALIAATRVRCAAQDLLFKTGIDLTALRNTALSYFTSGRMPRRLTLQRDPPPGPPRAAGGRPVGAPPLPPAPQSRRTATVQQSPGAPETRRELCLRDLVDEPALDEAQGEAPRALASPAPPRGQPTALRPLAPLEGAPLGRAPPAPSERPTAATSAALDAREYPLLAGLGRNLTQLARDGRLDPVVGRAREIDEVIDVLGKRRTNNPCLVGDPGVGKTAVVEGVASQLASLRGPLGDKLVLELDMASLVAGTHLRGSFSERLNGIKDEVRRAAGRVIVFIDELHTLIGAGATGEGPQDAANELKAAMARGEFPCIGATTHDEYRKYIQGDPALERRFTAVTVNEPSVAETVYILNGVAGRYAEHHGLTYHPDALQAAATLSAKYIADRHLPDKAISVLDLAGSRARREGKELVEPVDVARTVAKLAHIPEERLVLSDSERLLGLEPRLRERVVGHDEVIGRLGKVLRRNFAGFSSRRPLGSFLFLGPTGVGKSYLASCLAEALFGSAEAQVRLDMSEMSEVHGVSRLIGAPAGYVGYGEGGQLTEPVRRRPSSVVVLDEIDKASREALLLLLQVLEEGRLTDGRGRRVDFCNAVLILTSNLGAEAFASKTRAVGFAPRDGGTEPSPRADGERRAAAERAALDAARRALPLELWNRVDERCCLHPLDQPQAAHVARLLLAESSRRLRAERGIEYDASAEAIELLLARGGFDAALGARPLRQTVQRLIEGPLAERILGGEFASGDLVHVSVRDGQLEFHSAAASAA